MTKTRRILALLLLMAVALSLSASARAEKATDKVVRVGWYESAFHHTDEFGRRSGYGYEYQKRVSIYTGWTYEYVEGSWSELLEKLMAGEIDLLTDVSYTPARAEKILYSAEAMGSEGYHVFINPDNTEIRPDDFSTLNGKRVAVNKNSIQEQLFISWCQSHDVTPQIVETTEKTPQLRELLADGTFDALVTLDTYGNSWDVVPVCKVGYAESFFGINKNRPDLKMELDVAMNRLFEDNRDFNLQLTDRFNRSSAVNSFLTGDEVAWVAAHGCIRVGYRNDFLPFCTADPETGAVTGFLSEFLLFAETAEKNATLDFEAVAFTNTAEALEALNRGEIDCVFPLSISAYDGEKHGVIVTDPMVQTEMYAVVQTADFRGVSGDREMNVAVVAGNPNYATFLMDNFPLWTEVEYPNVEAAFDAVAEGKADAALVSNYRLGRMTALLARDRLSALTTGKAMDMSFCVRQGDDCLYSILNKLTRLYPETALHTSLTEHSVLRERMTVEEFIRENLTLFITGAIILFIIVLLLVLYARSASFAKQLISATEIDDLTGLYNRKYFFQYANRRHREHPDTPMDAVAINIEQFHALNALHGREMGDQILRALGNGLMEIAKGANGIAGRFEADRFDLFCQPREDYEQVFTGLQEKVRDAVPSANIRLRMGVMPWQKSLEPVQLFDRARTACNMARGHYKKHLIVYDQVVSERESFELRLINDLPTALETNQFTVYYQPKYDIQSDPPRLVSAEALVRWNHPGLGLVSPGDFIPLFEKNGQISLLDKYVWQQAAGQIAAWREAYGVTIPVSVNLSRVDVFDPMLEEVLEGILTANGLTHVAFKLEITESAYTDNADHILQVVERLHDQGYQVEMDDFGTGYSSLNMLSSMPIDILKMDREFIRNIDYDQKNRQLVGLILDIAHNLKVPVIAEGVETENQYHILREMGCAMVQGFYFSRPLPAEEFEKRFLAERKGEMD